MEQVHSTEVVVADETPDQTVQTEAPAAASLEAQLTTATTETAAAPDSPTSTVVTAPDGAAVAAPQADRGDGWTGVRDYARSQGVDLPYQDDVAALQALMTAYKGMGRRDYYADLGQRLAPQAPQIQQYLEQQSRAAAAPQAPPAWQPPPFDKAWVAQVELDEATGQLRSKPGYDPAIAEKVRAYKDWRDGFLDNPEKVVGPLVESRARDLIRQEFAQHQQNSVAQDIVRGHAGWMYVADGRGRQQFTPEGAVYATAVQQYAGVISDPKQLDAVATMAVQNAVYRQRAATAAPAASPAAAVPTSPASAGGSNVRPGSSGVPAPAASQKGRSLREMLLASTDRADLSESTWS